MMNCLKRSNNISHFQKLALMKRHIIQSKRRLENILRMCNKLVLVPGLLVEFSTKTHRYTFQKVPKIKRIYKYQRTYMLKFLSKFILFAKYV